MKKSKGPPFRNPTTPPEVFSKVANKGVVDLNVIKTFKDLGHMTVNLNLQIRISKWQRFRLWLGIKLIVVGARLTGMPLDINVNMEKSNEPNQD